MNTTSTHKHVVFLQSAHPSTDERVCYHQAKTLRENGFIVDIVDASAFANFCPYQADIYIVDTPRALWKIRHLDTKRVYDITEWYPSKKNIRHLKVGKITKAILMAVANLWAGYKADAIIYGEIDKAIPFKRLFPRKKAIELSYYPDLQYIKSSAIRDIRQQCRIFYAGPLTKEKGWMRVVDTVQELAQQLPTTTFILTTISKDIPHAIQCPKNLTIQNLLYLPFPAFCHELANHDIFIDLRDADIENTRCLPIKLFYYMATGKPSVFSSLQAIRKGVPEIDSATRLVHNSQEATQAIYQYITQPQLYQQHCKNAARMAQQKYNWECIKQPFIQLIHEL